MSKPRATYTAAQLGALVGMSAPAMRRMLKKNGVQGIEVGSTGKRRRFSLFEVRRKLGDLWDTVNMLEQEYGEDEP